jgi:hypothetical protein
LVYGSKGKKILRGFVKKCIGKEKSVMRSFLTFTVYYSGVLFKTNWCLEHVAGIVNMRNP